MKRKVKSADDDEAEVSSAPIAGISKITTAGVGHPNSKRFSEDEILSKIAADDEHHLSFFKEVLNIFQKQKKKIVKQNLSKFPKEYEELHSFQGNIKKFNEFLWEQRVPEGQNLYSMIKDHSFNQQLFSGELDPKIFKIFIFNDLSYMRDSALAWYILYKRAQETGRAEFYFTRCIKSLKMALNIIYLITKSDILSKEAKQDYLSLYKDNPTKHFEFKSYDRHLLKWAINGTEAEAISALLPCYNLFYKLWDDLQYLYNLSESKNPYKEWIEKGYKIPSSSANELTKMLLYFYNRSNKEQQQKMRENWNTSLLMEYLILELCVGKQVNLEGFFEQIYTNDKYREYQESMNRKLDILWKRSNTISKSNSSASILGADLSGSISQSDLSDYIYASDLSDSISTSGLSDSISTSGLTNLLLNSLDQSSQSSTLSEAVISDSRAAHNEPLSDSLNDGVERISTKLRTKRLLQSRGPSGQTNRDSQSLTLNDAAISDSGAAHEEALSDSLNDAVKRISPVFITKPRTKRVLQTRELSDQPKRVLQARRPSGQTERDSQSSREASSQTDYHIRLKEDQGSEASLSYTSASMISDSLLSAFSDSENELSIAIKYPLPLVVSYEEFIKRNLRRKSPSHSRSSLSTVSERLEG